MIEIQLNELLKKRKMRMSELIKETGLSQSYLSKVAKSKQGFSLVSLNKVCKVLKCQPGQLLKYKEEVN